MDTKTIRELSAYEDDWALKVRVARKTTREIHDKSERKTETMRIYLLDYEGSLVQATLFNEIIDKFYEKLECGKSYVIRNGNARPVKKHFDSVNDKIELTFTNATVIEEITECIPYTRTTPFVNYNDVEDFSKGKRLMDVVGMVIAVKPVFMIKLTNGTNKTAKKREVTLLNDTHNTIKLDLWGDLANNEGDILDAMVTLRPVIAALNVTINKFKDEIRLTTSRVSIIEINPEDEKSKAFQKRLEDMDIVFGPSKRMNESVEESLDNIITSTVDSMYCTFIGTVVKVLSKNTMWYDKCSKCNSTVRPEGNNKTVFCKKCNDENSYFRRHFLVKLVVTDGKQEVYATLFDAAETIVGCPVKTLADHTLSLQDKHKSIYYNNLMSCQGKSYKFLVHMDNKRAEDRANKNIVVEEVFKIGSAPFGEGTSTHKRKLESSN